MQNNKPGKSGATPKKRKTPPAPLPGEANPWRWSTSDYDAKGMLKLTVRLPAKTLELLAQLAENAGITRQKLVETLVEEKRSEK